MPQVDRCVRCKYGFPIRRHHAVCKGCRGPGADRSLADAPANGAGPSPLFSRRRGRIAVCARLGNCGPDAGVDQGPPLSARERDLLLAALSDGGRLALHLTRWPRLGSFWGPSSAPRPRVRSPLTETHRKRTRANRGEAGLANALSPSGCSAQRPLTAATRVHIPCAISSAETRRTCPSPPATSATGHRRRTRGAPRCPLAGFATTAGPCGSRRPQRSRRR